MRDEDIIDLKRLGSILFRQKVLILSCTGGFFLLALSYVMMTKPLYTARTDLLIDESITEAVSDISSVKQMSFEKSSIESEVEVMRSRQVTDAAAALLEKEGKLAPIAGNEKDKAVVAARLLNGLDVKRVGETYVLSVSYTFGDPDIAAAAANAYAKAYIAEELEALNEISSRTVDWMQTQVDKLGSQLIAAKQDVADYRELFNRYQRSGKLADLTVRQGNSEKKIGVKDGIGKLRELEQEERTLLMLYDTYLEKLKTISMQRSFPVTETRIITAAVPPPGKSHPRSALFIGVALIFGSGIGILLALVRDNFDSTLRRAGQARREIKVPFLGFFPREKHQFRKSFDFVSRGGKLSHAVELYAQSVEEPFSQQTETVRTILNAIERLTDGKTSKVVGIISAGPEDGRKIVASNLALYIAQASRCLLIDADIRNSTDIRVDSEMQPHNGLGNVLSGKASLEDTLLVQNPGRLALLPSVAAEAAEALPHATTHNTAKLVETCKTQFDYVLIDLPPLLAPADVYSFGRVVDCFIIVAEWGKTLPNALNFHLTQNGIPRERIIGTVLANADMGQMEKYYGHKSS